MSNLNHLIINESGTATHIENYKIVIIGDQYVGKTSILHTFKYETQDDKYAPTLGIDFITKNVFLEDKTIRLVMWDTAGSERFKSLIPSYLKNAQALILAFDLTNKASFQSLPSWLNDINEQVPTNTFIILCGNKVDLENKRNVSFEEALKFANDHKLQYIEVSAKTGHNIEKLFATITSSLYEGLGTYSKNDKTVFLDPGAPTEQKKKKCCKS